MIRALLAILVLCLGCAVPQLAVAQSPATTQSAVRFEVVDVYVDSGDRPLAAWQVELTATSNDVTIVGVEGGDHKDIYRDPPYYDAAALAGGRIIIASYTTHESPPKGKIHVARLHLQTRGEYTLSTKVLAAAEAKAEPISATASTKAKE